MNVPRCCAGWLRLHVPVAMIEEIPAIATVGFDSAAAFVQECMVRTTQRHEIRQRCFTAIGPVLSVMAVYVAAVRTTGKAARSVT